MHYKSFEWLLLLFPSLSSSPLTYLWQGTVSCQVYSLCKVALTNDENSEFVKIKIEYRENAQSWTNLSGITNWGQSKLPKLMELQEMGLAGNQNIFKMYEAVHQKSCIVVDLKGSRPPKDTCFGLVWATEHRATRTTAAPLCLVLVGKNLFFGVF